MLQGEHSAILSIFIKLPFVNKIFVLSIFEWPFYTGFTVHVDNQVDRVNSNQTVASKIWCLSKHVCMRMNRCSGLSSVPNHDNKG